MGNEQNALYEEASELDKFDYHWLAGDGKIIRIKHELRLGLGVFKERPEAKQKYEHLTPKGYAATPLGFFEYGWLDANGGTKKIEEQLELGNDIFWRKADEVKLKYAPLEDRYLYQIKVVEFGLLDDDGGTSATVFEGRIRHLILPG